MKVRNLRWFIQFLAFFVLVYGGLLAIDLGNKLPTFACRYVDTRGGMCFLFPFQMLLEHTPFKAYVMNHGYRAIRLLQYFGTFFVLSIILSKAWCGWLCPFGLLQDLASELRSRLNIRYSFMSWSTRDKLQWIKYAFLLVFVFLIPLLMANYVFPPETSRDLTNPFCQICPARLILPIVDGNFSQIYLDTSSAVKFILTALALVIAGISVIGAFFYRRFVCRFCPMNAFLSLFDRVGFMQLKKDPQKCTKCGNCYRVCPMEIREIYLEDKKTNVLNQDCMLCLRCIESCPEDGALKATYLGKAIFTSSAEGFYTRQNAGKMKKT